MDTNLKIASALCSLCVVVALALPANAQIDTRVEQSNTSVHQPDSTENPLNYTRQYGTSELQLKVLKEINHHLMAGFDVAERSERYES